MTDDLETLVDERIRKALDLEQFPPIMRDVDVARMLSLSVDWLRDLRAMGKGPPTLRLGRKAVRYDREQALAWARSHGRGS